MSVRVSEYCLVRHLHSIYVLFLLRVVRFMTCAVLCVHLFSNRSNVRRAQRPHAIGGNLSACFFSMDDLFVAVVCVGRGRG